MKRKWVAIAYLACLIPALIKFKVEFPTKVLAFLFGVNSWYIHVRKYVISHGVSVQN